MCQQAQQAVVKMEWLEQFEAAGGLQAGVGGKVEMEWLEQFEVAGGLQAGVGGRNGCQCVPRSNIANLLPQ